MDDHSHLRKEHDTEEKGLINAEGTGHEGAALLARMKHISELIQNVSSQYPALLYSNLLLYRELSLSLDKNTPSLYSSSLVSAFCYSSLLSTSSVKLTQPLPSLLEPSLQSSLVILV
jgi:hypothetical protein